MSFKTYIKRILPPKFRIKKEPLDQLNRLIHVMIDKVTSTSVHLASLNKKKTITLEIMKKATQLTFDDTKDGEKALKSYKRNKKISSRTERSGLLLSVPEVEKVIRNGTSLKVSESGIIYLSGVIEGLIKELLELCVFHLSRQDKVTIALGDLIYVTYDHRKFAKLVCTLDFLY